MKKLLLAATAFFGLAASAQAGVITVSALDDGVGVLLLCTGGVNAPISCGGSSAHFSTINIGAIGAPPLAGASLASVTIDATSASGGHTLDIDVLQGGLLIAGLTGATSTFTINHLIAPPGTSFGATTESTLVNGAALSSYTFPAGTVNDTRAFAAALPGLVTSTEHKYSITFQAAGQSATDTIQLVTNAPEPMTLALLGTGLLGLGIARRKN